jgi:geranyl-CoA carboxylase alpha subunit
VLVALGDTVAKGDKLAVLEAMKMQHSLLAEIDGVVLEVTGVAGNQLAADDLILEIEPQPSE